MCHQYNTRDVKPLRSKLAPSLKYKVVDAISCLPEASQGTQVPSGPQKVSQDFLWLYALQSCVAKRFSQLGAWQDSVQLGTLPLYSAPRFPSLVHTRFTMSSVYIRPVVPGGARGALAPADFGRSVKPISTKIILAPPDFQTFRQPHT